MFPFIDSSPPKTENGRVAMAVTLGHLDYTGLMGILADVRALAAVGVRPAAVVTAIGRTPLSESAVRQQAETVAGRFPVDAVMTGRLPTERIVRVIADAVGRWSNAPAVIDAAFVGRAGDARADDAAIGAWQAHLAPVATVLVLNIDEASHLTGRGTRNRRQRREACRQLFGLGARSVLITGGREDGPAMDLLYDGEGFTEFGVDRVDVGDLYGAGSVLVASLAGHLARGNALVPAIEAAKAATTAAIAGAVAPFSGVQVAEPMCEAWEKMHIDPTPVVPGKTAKDAEAEGDAERR